MIDLEAWKLAWENLEDRRFRIVWKRGVNPQANPWFGSGGENLCREEAVLMLRLLDAVAHAETDDELRQMRESAHWALSRNLYQARNREREQGLGRRRRGLEKRV